jgi:hypothetical protein
MAQKLGRLLRSVSGTERLPTVEQQAVPFNDARLAVAAIGRGRRPRGVQSMILSLSSSCTRHGRSGSNSEMGRGCSRRAMLDASIQ